MKLFSRYKIIVVALTVVGVILFNACKKDEPPHNPYSDIDYGDTLATADTVGQFTITGLHRNIFSQKCAQPGCHDGSFEPDFRTVESTYSSLVFHPLVKTDSTGFFKYRVKPGDTLHSWLHERLITDDEVLGRMPLYSNPLSATELNQINTWIMNGAPNAGGVLPPDVNGAPTIPGYICLNMSNIRVDSNRVDDVDYNPFILAANTQYQLVFIIEDDITDISAMQNVRGMFSGQANGFPTTPFPATYFSVGQLKFWRILFNTNQLPPAMQTYFRFYCNDGNQPDDTEFPRNDLAPEYKSFFSFVIQ